MEVLKDYEIDLVTGGTSWVVNITQGVVSSLIYDAAGSTISYVVDGVLNPTNYDTSQTGFDPMGNYTGIPTYNQSTMDGDEQL